MNSAWPQAFFFFFLDITTTTGNLLGKNIWLQPYSHKAEVFYLKQYLNASQSINLLLHLKLSFCLKKVTLLWMTYRSTNQKSKGRDPDEMKEVWAAHKPLLDA